MMLISHFHSFSFCILYGSDGIGKTVVGGTYGIQYYYESIAEYFCITKKRSKNVR